MSRITSILLAIPILFISLKTPAQDMRRDTAQAGKLVQKVKKGKLPAKTALPKAAKLYEKHGQQEKLLHVQLLFADSLKVLGEQEKVKEILGTVQGLVAQYPQEDGFHRGRQLYLQAWLAYAQGEKTKYTQLYEKAIEIFSRSPRTAPYLYTCHRATGVAKYSNDTENALGHFKACYALAAYMGKEDKQEGIDANNNIGATYYMLNNYPEAIRYYKEAMAKDKELHGEDSPNTSRYLNNIASVYQNQEKFEKAIRHYNKGIDHLQTHYPEKTIKLALYYNNLANVLEYTEPFDVFIKYRKKAIKLHESYEGNDNLREKIAAYANIGINYNTRGEYNRALDYYMKAYRTGKAAGHPLPHFEMGYTANNIGDVYAAKKEHAEALKWHKKFRQHFLELLHEDDYRVGISEFSIGSDYTEMEQYDSAYYYLKQAEPKIREGQMTYYLYFFCQAMAGYYTSTQEYTQALALTQEALEHAQALYPEKHPEVSGVYRQISVIYLEMGKLEKSREYIEKAHNATTDNYRILQSQQTLKNNSLHQQIEEASYTKTHSTQALQNIIQYAHKARAGGLHAFRWLNEAPERTGLSGQLAQIDHAAMVAALRLAKTGEGHWADTAFGFAEQSKAIGLQLARLEAMRQANTPSADTLRELARQIRYTENWLADAEGDIAEAVKQHKEDQLFTYREKYRKLQGKSLAQRTHTAMLKEALHPVGLAQLQAQIPTGTTVVSFTAKDSLFYRFVVRPNAVKWDTIAAPPVEEAIAGLRYHLLEARSKRTSRQTATHANFLRQSLLDGAISTGTKQLVIIPDRQLFYLPWAMLPYQALQAGKGWKKQDYLSGRIQISQAMSATLFLQRLKKTPKTETKPQMLALAPVTHEGKKAGMRGLSEANKQQLLKRRSLKLEDVPTLPYSQQETRAVQQASEANQVAFRALTGKDANFGIFYGPEVSQPGFLHIATHGIVGDKPFEAALLLRNDTAARYTSLHIEDIFRARLRAKLTVLSACETGVGGLGQGGGLVSLNYAFLYAGSRNTLASLWQVNDKATARLMKQFYTQLFSNGQNDYPGALAKAQRAMQQGRYSHPYYWAGWSLFGLN